MKGFGLGKWCFLQYEWTELDETATARKQVVGQSACMRALGAYSKASNHSLQTGADTLVAPTSRLDCFGCMASRRDRNELLQSSACIVL
jgi:hypothetical protein